MPISDIELSNITLTCGRSIPLTAEIFPENATKTDITWQVTDGDASIISGRITAKKSGIITIKATVSGGGDKGGDYEKYFEIYAEEAKKLRGNSEYNQEYLEFIIENCTALTKGKPETFAQGLQLMPHDALKTRY